MMLSLFGAQIWVDSVNYYINNQYYIWAKSWFHVKIEPPWNHWHIFIGSMKIFHNSKTCGPTLANTYCAGVESGPPKQRRWFTWVRQTFWRIHGLGCQTNIFTRMVYNGCIGHSSSHLSQRTRQKFWFRTMNVAGWKGFEDGTMLR